MPLSSSRRRRAPGEFSLFHRATALIAAFTLLPGPVPVAFAVDILRHGIGAATGTSATQTSSSGTGAGSSADSTAAARQDAADAISRTNTAIQAVQAMQNAAHSLALTVPTNNLGPNPNAAGTLPDVPDGLTTGGLVLSGTPTGASTPTQTASGGNTTVNIVQNQQQAFINWSSFNIGRHTTLNFDQSAGGSSVGQWIAFNRVTDPTGNPSQILGSITAQGQVYVINQNGIIFGGSSQVNVNTLVASTLPINDNLVSSGLLNQTDVQFLFSALPQAAGANGTPATTPPAVLTPSGNNGDITVQAGAQLTSPSVSGSGGRIALIAPNVTNNGSIATPDGQTIIAGGLQVGFTAHSSSDPSLRGLDVYVGSVGSYGGTVTNAGIIDAPRGNVTMTGKEVNQNGVITSTTSVALNGRIDLNASYGAISNVAYNTTTYPDSPAYLYTASGTVSTGAGGVTQILPEWASTTTVVGTQLALVSQVNITGQSVYFGSGSTLLAPNAQVKISAGIWDFVVSADSSVPSVATFTNAGGQIYVDSGALLNVAGSTDVSASVNEFILTVQLRSNELANSPLQRTGVLDNQTVTVDLRNTGTYNGRVWYGTPLADLAGYVGVIQRTVGELTTAGGTISMNAGGSVVVQPTARLDVSGGWINYQGAQVQTTQLVYNGQIINIANATPDLVYSGIYTGQTTTTQGAFGTSSTTTSLFGLSDTLQPSYTQGGNGGSLSISATGLALDGGMFGYTVSGGLQQRTTPPAASSLTVSLQAQQAATPYVPTYPAGATVYLRPGGTQAAVGAFSVSASDAPLTTLSSSRSTEVDLSPDLVSVYGFGTLSVSNVNGAIVLPASSVLNAGALGSVTLKAANIDIEGTIFAPGGSITLTAYDIGPDAVLERRGDTSKGLPAYDPTRGFITLGAAGVLSTSGLVVDERTTTGLALPLVTKGGSITLTGSTLDLAAGGVLDVSGGAQVSSNAQVTFGNGGTLTLKAGQDAELKGVLGGGLSLGAYMRGFSGATGGTLSLLSEVIQVGGTTTDPGTLVLDPSFFSQGGFNAFTLTGLGEVTSSPDVFTPAVVISAGTVLAPVAQSWVAQLSQGLVTLTPQTLAQGVRQPVKLDFEAPGVLDEILGAMLVRGEIIMQAGSTIQTDPLGSVKFAGQTVALLGSVSAPGGTITVAGGTQYADFVASPSQGYITVDLASGSSLSTAGTTLLTANAYGLRRGTVLAGGTISISGNIAAEAGAVLDASGASGVLDLTPAEAGQAVTTPLTGGTANGLLAVATRIDSNGGTISFKGAEMLFLDATLSARAGGATAEGGSLTVASGRFYATGSPQLPSDLNILVTQNTATIPVLQHSADGDAIGQSVKTGGGALVTQQGYFRADTFQNGGFDSLSLAGNVQFSGAVSITAPSSITLATGGVLTADGTVNLSAPYVDLGTAFRTPLQVQQTEYQPYLVNNIPFYIPPTFGTGTLNVTGSLIDIGFLSLQGIGTANLTAANGDIRGDGILDVAGTLTMTAGQVYTPTALSFTIAAYDYTSGGTLHKGAVNFAASGVRNLPLSAGGKLNVYASTINQGGTLVAPAGIINLGWDGTGTSPQDLLSGAGTSGGPALPVTSTLNILAGSRTSVSEIDPLTGLGVVIPYGFSTDGTTWIDPTGVDISGGGLPVKAVNTSAQNLAVQQGAVIDLRGGGDLYAYRWVSGTGGTVDILASQGSFAVVPGYSGLSAPYGLFNGTTDSVNLASGQSGYSNSTIKVGDQVYLAGGSGLAAGVYTLLPARYALLPGAFLVTPESGQPQGSALQPDGASLVSGYHFNGLNTSVQASTLYASFEVAPGSVVHARAQYDGFNASTFLQARAQTLNLSVPLLPQDAGNLVLESLQTMSFAGQVLGTGAASGRGADIDINSPSDILIATAGTSAAPGVLVLDAAQLSSYGVESVLIGGQRSTTTAGTRVSVSTTNITVANSAANSLTMPEIILAASGSITLNAGASIVQTGTMRSSAATLLLGRADTPGSGNGVLLRVSSDTAAQVLRSGVTVGGAPTLTISDGALVTGNSVTLDSTSTLSLSTAATITGQALNVNSSRISVQLASPGGLQPSPGLVLAGTLLQNLQQAQSLSLLSYSSIDIYGTGTLGSAQMTNLALHAGEIRGFNNGGGSGAVTLTAQNLLLDNLASATGPGAVSGATGSLVATALNKLTLGTGTLNLDQFSGLSVTAGNGIVMQGTGGLSVQGSFSASTPVLTGAAFASQSLTATGGITLSSSVATGTAATGGLGASLSLTGATVSSGASIDLPSGTLSLAATGGDVTVTGRLNVGGTGQTYYDQVRYTDAGKIFLSSTTGNVNLMAGSIVNLSASTLGGSAGTLTVSTPAGTLNLGGTLQGSAPAGQAGSFVLTSGALPSLAVLNTALDSAGIDFSRNIRVLSGDVVLDGYAQAHSFTLSADQGSITVTGGVDASGSTGGSILLSAYGSIILSAGLAQTTATGSSGSVITLNDATGVYVGQAVSGLNVASGTYVSAVNGSQITLSQALSSSVPASTALTFGARLSAAASTFDSAGKGGNISLMAGSERNGVINTSAVLDMRSGTQIDLSVAGSIPSSTLNVSANVATNVAASLGGYDTITATQAGVITLNNGQTITLAANTPTSVIGAKTVTLSSDGSVSFAGSSAWGLYTGTLQLRAPQNASANNLQMNAINAQIAGASVITAEGYKIFTPTSGTLNASVLSTITSNATTFTSNTATITSALFASNPNAAALKSIFYLLPGAEVLNRTGNLTLGTATSSTTADWNLSAARFGPNLVPGILTMRAAGNLVFNNSLSDGFATGAYTAALSALNTALPTNLQSWSFRLASGSDFTAVDYHQVVPQTITGIAATTGSLMLGRNAGAAAATSPGTNASTTNIIGTSTSTTYKFQTIRTGTGSIDIATGGDVQFLNQFATIYTAGALVANAKLGGTFNVPRPTMASTNVGSLGLVQEAPAYAVQYTMGGGNVSVNAQGSIIQLTKDTGGNLIADSKRTMPTDWLFRRGAVDPASGVFTRSKYDSISNPDVASTSWWVDFANFFENFGALGGGNISLVAGHSVTNVNAVIPTNARMQGTDASGNPIAPSAGNMVELGGGSLLVQTGQNIDGGVYYVERGSGTLNAGGSIVTNSTRSPSLGILSSFSNPDVLNSSTWLPTTLFVGKSRFNVKAGGNVLLGPVANAFLMPQGYSNSYWYKTYFSTYSADSGVSISSLAGDVTLRESMTLPTVGFVQAAMPILQAWYQTQLLLSPAGGATGGNTASMYQPWLKLVEDSVAPFTTAATIMPASLTATAFTGSVNVVGTINLTPSPTGTLSLLAAGAVNGLNATGAVSFNGADTTVWNSGLINLSDADPAFLPGILNPFAYQTIMPSRTSVSANTTKANFLLSRLDAYFNETGSTIGSAAVLQSKQTLHAAGLLHANDTTPAYIYALSGSISGFTLFSAKATQVISGQDVSDISLYVQNNRAGDLSIVAAARDIIPYNANTPLRVISLSSGNITGLGEAPKAGDIQINGPGTLEVLSGRNLDLGVGSNNADGTGSGITSIGNGRNPYLPYAGADVVAAAGLGGAAVGISNAGLNFTSFINTFGTSPAGSRYLAELAEALGVPSINLNDPALSADQKDRYALALFYLVLRDAGRDHNDPASANYKTYDAGFQAISALFPTTTSAGTINTESRDIRTKSGSSISLLAPGGALLLSPTAVGTQLAPPGIITEAGGSISIFTKQSVEIGISRIFTLKGGDITIWSSTGDIAAGTSAKTVQSAPPTRVIIDPQSASVSTDLAGLATGGGIGALATIANIKPSNIDLIAPLGAVDAGDAGIRASGNLNIAATVVLNSSNIQVAGSTSGAPSAPSVAAPNIGGLSSANSTTAATSNVAQQQQQQQQQQSSMQQEDTPSLITVEVLGYGGGGDDERRQKTNQPGE